MKFFYRQKQRGFVLAVSMIFLVIMTVLAITAIRRTTLDEKVAGNLRGQNVAFQAAEKALRYCESVLELRTGNVDICTQKTGLRADLNAIQIQPSDPATADFANPQANFPQRWALLANWTGGAPLASRVADVDVIANVAAQPQCMIERWDFALAPGVTTGPTYAYVITARAVGSTNTAVAWLQETIRCGSQ
ncbi:N/A [soil metagenome]